MAKKIETPEEKAKREQLETIATNISELAESVRSLLKGPLNRKALLVLLASSTSLPQRTVSEVLSALENLEKDWLN